MLFKYKRQLTHCLQSLSSKELKATMHYQKKQKPLPSWICMPWIQISRFLASHAYHIAQNIRTAYSVRKENGCMPLTANCINTRWCKLLSCTQRPSIRKSPRLKDLTKKGLRMGSVYHTFINQQILGVYKNLETPTSNSYHMPSHIKI